MGRDDSWSATVPSVVPSGDCSHYYYYYAAFNAPCVGHKADESQARGHVDLRVAVSVIKRIHYIHKANRLISVWMSEVPTRKHSKWRNRTSDRESDGRFWRFPIRVS